METEGFKKGHWYSAIYEDGFRIIFQVIEISSNSVKLLRKDGVTVESIPPGYTGILANGIDEPEYE